MNFSKDRIINAYETIKFLIQLALVMMGASILGTLAARILIMFLPV